MINKENIVLTTTASITAIFALKIYEELYAATFALNQGNLDLMGTLLMGAALLFGLVLSTVAVSVLVMKVSKIIVEAGSPKW